MSLVRTPMIVVACAMAMLLVPMCGTALAVNTTLTVNKTAAPGTSFTVVDDAGQISCGADCSGSYAEDCDDNIPPICTATSVTLTVTTQTPGTFIDWGPAACVDGGSTCSVRAQGAVSVALTDVQDPTVQSASIADIGGRVGPGPVSLQASVSDNAGVGSVGFMINGQFVGGDSIAPYQVSWSPTQAHGVSVQLTIVASDLSGRQIATGTLDSATIDKEVLASFQLTPPALTRATDVEARFTADAGAALTCSFDNSGLFLPCASPLTWSVQPGARRIQVRATDDVGNVNTLSHEFVVDRTAPGISFVAPNEFVYIGLPTTISYSVVEDNGATITCAVDDGPYSPCSASSTTLSGVADGLHTVKVKAIDGAGNEANAARSFLVNAQPPTISISPLASTTIIGTGFTFQFLRGDDTIASVECRVWPAGAPAPAWGPCSAASSHTAAGLAPGSYDVQVRATDRDGMTGESAAMRITLAQTATPTPPATPLQRMSRTVPAVRGRTVRGRYAVSLVQIARLPARASVRFTCAGRGCPRGGAVRVVRNVATVAQLARRQLAVGAVVTVTASSAGYRPMVVTVRIIRGGSARVTVQR